MNNVLPHCVIYIFIFTEDDKKNTKLPHCYDSHEQCNNKIQTKKIYVRSHDCSVMLVNFYNRYSYHILLICYIIQWSYITWNELYKLTSVLWFYRNANREDPDQTNLSKVPMTGSAQFVDFYNGYITTFCYYCFILILRNIIRTVPSFH